ncbi:hypothetical protein N5D48_01325 [Pseudomonas sp. GD03858]|uniref:dermonecrotic toxin domain-containing protein n=1 Tax=unclassified Pseudomonas TaxID=196821 RepID=UPI002449884B|nr:MULTISPECIES: DUF6543 domain-containing protein [unclassified Pseudomonas]MDH0646043.1 hypothetical protein [Pseudomonas sp. GD03867]MDH0661035.1 hypothetical protein [Pseudomonas sp. GD03858]
MATPATPPVTIREAVVLQFAQRPSLRYVLSKAIHELLLKHDPDKVTATIDHHSEEPYTLVRPGLDGKLRPERLLSLLLGVFVQGQRVAFGVRDTLRLKAFGFSYLEDFFEQVTGVDSDDDSIELPLAPLNDAFNELLESLVAKFQQAQANFWDQDNGATASIAHISRHGWMREVLRSIQLNHVVRSDWGDEEKDCLYAVMLGLKSSASVSAIELTFTVDGASFKQLLPDLLIEAERETSTLIVRCEPGGRIQRFESLADFTDNLRDELAQRLDFDELTWQRRTFTADPFLQQSGLLLDSLLADVERLIAASEPDRFEYQVAMLDLAAAQGLSRGKTSLDGVEDLHAFAVRRLKEQMALDHPDEPGPAPDEVLVHVSVPDPIVDVELPVKLKPVGSKTLAEFSIARLDGQEDALISSISHRDGKPLAAWMTPVQVVELVERVDIGGTYPAYVATLLDDSVQQAARIERFGREWRCALLFDALRAKVEGKLDAACWRALAEFCRSERDLKGNIDIAPLAFKADADSQRRDAAMYMYVIRLREPAAVLLYRPLYQQQSLLSYADEAALMDAISAAGELQDSVLQWLPETVFNVYARGGFLEPHLRRVIFDTSIWPEPVKPVRLALSPFLVDIDTWMYDDKRRALILLAGRGAISNTQQRWATIKRFGWLLFDLVAPVLPGALGKVAWVAGLLAPLLETEKGTRPEGADTILAVDLAANLSMALLHERLPETRPKTYGPESEPSRLAGPALREPFRVAQVAQQVRHEPEDLALQDWTGHVSLGHGWGVGPYAQREILKPFKAVVDLAGVVPHNDVYQHDGRSYVAVLGDKYQVVLEGEGRRIVGPAGEPGPWLFHDGGWRVRIDGFALGGAPKRTGGARVTQAQVKSQASALKTLINNYDTFKADAFKLSEIETGCRVDWDKAQTFKSNIEQSSSGLEKDKRDLLLSLSEKKLSDTKAAFEKARSDYVVHMEKMVENDLQVISGAEKLIDMQRRPGIAKVLDRITLEAQIIFSRETIVRSIWGATPRLSDMIDYPGLSKLGSMLHGRIVTEVPELYQTFRQRISETTLLQERQIKLSSQLDQQLPYLDPQGELVRDAEDRVVLRVGELMKQRTLTTVDIQFQQAVHYCELTIHYEMADPTRKLMRYRQTLMSLHLRAAAYAHGEAQFGSLTASDQVEALQSAWDEYTSAIVGAMDIRREGSALLDMSRLDQYIEVIELLKKDAGDRLVEAISASDGDSVPAVGAYDPSGRVRAVAHRADGQIMVGERIEVDGKPVLEVRDPGSNQVIAHFELKGQEWVEVVEPPAPSPTVSESELLAQGSEVLARDQLFRTPVDQKLKPGLLVRAIDEQISELQHLADAFGDNSGTVALQVKEQLAQWPARREFLLTELYKTTRFPDFAGMRFLQKHNLIQVQYQRNRKVLSDGGALDEYAVRLRQGKDGKPGKNLWAVHYHYVGQADPANEFFQAHIKTWEQRLYGSKDAKRLAAQGDRIHRELLTAEQGKTIIGWAESTKA